MSGLAGNADLAIKLIKQNSLAAAYSGDDSLPMR